MPSSVIWAYAYDAESRTLAVKLTSGRRYRDVDVPAETHAALKLAFAKGEVFKRRIRGRFRHVARPA